MDISTYDYGDKEKKKWLRNNDKLIIVRHNDEHGEIIGLFYDDVAALEHIEKQMEYEGKSMSMLEMNWIEFHGYLNTKNITYRYKIIKNTCYRDRRGSRDSEECFWFQVVENNCLL